MLSARLAFAAAAALLIAAVDAPRAQAPAEPPASTPAQPAPAQPAPAPAPPAPAQPPADPAPQAQPAPSADPFGEEMQVEAKTIIFFKGTATWDSAFESLIDGFKTVQGFMQKEGIKPAGPLMTIYVSTDDRGFEFRAAVPIAAPPANPPQGDIEVGQSPSGKMLKFVHRGSYDAMDSTYEAITNYLDTKQLEALDTFIEEYTTDPLTTPEDQLVITVLVPIK